MLSIVANRLLQCVPVLIAVSLICFGLAELSPSDPAEIALRVQAITPTPELIAETRVRLGLDAPVYVRYGEWLAGVLTGDLGTSYVTGESVASLMLPALGNSLVLALAALVPVLVFGIGLGALCATNEDGMLDNAARSLVFLTASVPGFWIGLLFIWLFAVNLNLLPTSGFDSGVSVILPALTLSLAYIPAYARLVRSEMIANSRSNWVAFARGCGIRGARLYLRILVNSLRSSITALGMSIPKLIAGAFVVESVFAWPGLGRLCIEAVFNRDFPIVCAYVMTMATLFTLFNLASDILVAWMDPRERGQ